MSLEVRVVGKDVLLTGRVTSYHLKQIAQSLIRTECDGYRICNALEVVPVHYEEQE